MYLYCVRLAPPSVPARRLFLHRSLSALRLLSVKIRRRSILTPFYIQELLLQLPQRHPHYRPPNISFTEVQNQLRRNILCGRILPPCDCQYQGQPLCHYCGTDLFKNTPPLHPYPLLYPGITAPTTAETPTLPASQYIFQRGP